MFPTCFLLFFCRLPGQCHYLGLPVADYFKQWINLKKVPSELHPELLVLLYFPLPPNSCVFPFLYFLSIPFFSSLGNNALKC